MVTANDNAAIDNGRSDEQGIVRGGSAIPHRENTRTEFSTFPVGNFGVAYEQQF
jgi:hypothetical protein